MSTSNTAPSRSLTGGADLSASEIAAVQDSKLLEPDNAVALLDEDGSVLYCADQGEEDLGDQLTAVHHELASTDFERRIQKAAARVLRFMVWKARTRREDLPPTTLVEAELRNTGDMLSARLRNELSNVSPHGYELVPRSDPDIKLGTLVDQSSTHDIFRFFDLPAELRNRIYEYTILSNNRKGVRDMSLPYAKRKTSLRTHQGIVDLNKQTRLEAHGMAKLAFARIKNWKVTCHSVVDIKRGVN